VAEERTVAKNLDRQIRKNAKGPKRAKGDSGEMEQHSLKDQIEADRYLASKKAARKKGAGLKMSKLVPPGAG
jgi:hypothetical protein